MANEAEANSDGDKKHKEAVEAKNNADNLVYNTEKLLKENRDKISESDAKNLEETLDNCRKAINDGDTEQINSATEKLTSETHKLADVLYKQTPPQTDAPKNSPDGESSSEKPAEEEIIDAEYVDVDEKKK